MRARWWRLGLGLIAILVGCGEPRSDAGGPPPEPPLATATLRTSKIRISDTAEIEVRITTAPDQHVLQPEPPAVAGFEVIEWQALPILREPRRWTHRQRVRLRASEVGHFEWPRLQITVSDREGVRTALELPPIPLEVQSIRREHPNRTAPYGVRAAPPPPRRSTAPGLAIVAVGAALGLAVTAAVFRVRRRAEHRAAQPDAPTAPWTAALVELDRAAARAPTLTCHHAATTLRSYMDRRFGSQARTGTTEELTAATPPYGATSSWPAFIALLQDFDDLRFRHPGGSSDRTRSAVDTALTRARDFIEATIPPAGLQ